MMINAAKRTMVWRRSGSRCEYCRLHQDDFQFLTFHIEHIVPKQHGGSDRIANLCLSCPNCNLNKGTNVAGILRGKIVPLFNPRRQIWKRHFRWHQLQLAGKTAVGKVTVSVLKLNDDARVALREHLQSEGRFPPAD